MRPTEPGPELDAWLWERMEWKRSGLSPNWISPDGRQISTSTKLSTTPDGMGFLFDYLTNRVGQEAGVFFSLEYEGEYCFTIYPREPVTPFEAYHRTAPGAVALAVAAWLDAERE